MLNYEFTEMVINLKSKVAFNSTNLTLEVNFEIEEASLGAKTKYITLKNLKLFNHLIKTL